MAHEAQSGFCREVRNMLTEWFEGGRVLDIGSLDINGNNRGLFDRSVYVGLDVGPGPNVDVVCPAHLYRPESLFDVVISTEALEHDMHWKESLQNMVEVLRPGGLLLFTCATTGRGEHGTARTTPGDSPLTQSMWPDYYMNITESDVRSVWNCERLFSTYQFRVEGTDLYFWGVRDGMVLSDISTA